MLVKFAQPHYLGVQSLRVDSPAASRRASGIVKLLNYDNKTRQCLDDAPAILQIVDGIAYNVDPFGRELPRTRAKA